MLVWNKREEIRPRLKFNSTTTRLRSQPRFCGTKTGIPPWCLRNDCSKIPHQLQITTCTQICIVLLIGWSKISTTAQPIRTRALVPSLRHGWNYPLVKSVCETAPKSLFWAPPVYQDLSVRHDWPVKNAIIDLPVKMKENSKCCSSNSSNLLAAQNKEISAALQMLLTKVKLCLRCRLTSTLI